MPTPTDERPELLTVIAYIRAAAGQRDELRRALEALIEPTRREKGFVTYDLHQGVEDPTGSSSTRTGSRARTWTPLSRRPTCRSSP